MNAAHVLTLAVLSGAAAMTQAQDMPPPRPAPGGRLVAEVVSSDTRARTLTVRVAGGEATRRLRLSARAAGQAGRYKAGDRVELTCAPASPAPGANAPAGQGSPGPAPAGTGAAPGTGSTGVGTTGTGISGTGTPAPGTTGPATAAPAGPSDDLPPCGVVTRIVAAPAP